jgi:hypothetical protein
LLFLRQADSRIINFNFHQSFFRIELRVKGNVNLNLTLFCKLQSVRSEVVQDLHYSLLVAI